jgi:hypothetical protein
MGLLHEATFHRLRCQKLISPEQIQAQTESILVIKQFPCIVLPFALSTHTQWLSPLHYRKASMLKVFYFKFLFSRPDR